MYAKVTLVGSYGLDIGDMDADGLIIVVPDHKIVVIAGLTGIKNETIDNSASYIQNWLRALKNDVKIVVHAAGNAQKSVDYIVKKSGSD